MDNRLHICKSCKGEKKVTVTVETFGSTKKDSFETDCFWCKGTGEMNNTQLRDYLFFKDMWCECEEAHGVYFINDNEHPEITKHHYRCKNCNKVTQIG